MGQQAVAATRKPLRVRAGHRQIYRALRGRNGAPPARLERLSRRAADPGILDGQGLPPARALRVRARRKRRMEEDPPLSVEAARVSGPRSRELKRREPLEPFTPFE